MRCIYGEKGQEAAREIGFGSAGYYNLYIINKAGEPSFIVCGRSVGEEWYYLVYMSFTFNFGAGTLSRICCWWVGFEGEGSCYKRVLLVAIEDQAVAVLVPCGGGLGEAAGGGRGGGDGH
ncbi:hypothetical protein C5167_025201 [Papaver somniferum]|uniref:Uncharacterized protein n=1 Tax=Papaver somniferum TaxID=3469 RepID=A0A4Y7JUI1_PAPSO|nr:hypothetical protein C5167_025201 [Papaver somniferum]